MHRVLDLDLDFFVSPIAHWGGDESRLSAEEYKASSTEQVKSFLECQCKLSVGYPIPGKEFVHHEEAFSTWRKWIHAGVLAAPFEVIHVDAHADLGLGDGAWTFVLSELLALPVAQRCDRQIVRAHLNSANYLAFALANRWINRLIYVFPEGEGLDRIDGAPGDLMTLYFRNQDWKTGIIELAQYSPDEVKDLCMRSDLSPIRFEPPIPFDFMSSGSFQSSGFTHLVLAQSPQYTPRSADRLLSTIRQHFTPTD